MTNRLTTVERAFELARSGTCADVSHITQRLKAEGFDDVEGQLTGGSIRKQLRDLCAAAAVPSLPLAMTPDVSKDPAVEIEERGAPFDGGFA